MTRGDARRYWISLLITGAAFMVANVVDYFRYRCHDCYVAYGVPFMYLQDGGWVPVQILWNGVAADLAVIGAFAGVVGWVSTRLKR